LSKDIIPIPAGHFRKIASSKFVPRNCIAILADERDAYAGLKKVLYAGTCAWMIAPQNPELIKGAITLAALKALSEAEESDFAGFRSKSSAADMHARYIVLGPKFIEEIYYPLGGALGLARAPSIKDFKASLSRESPRIDYAISVVQIYHHHVIELSGERRYGKPSLNKAADLIAELGILHGDFKGPPRSRYMRDAWSQSRESIALLYAASTIQTGNGNTLLDKIKLGANNLQVDGPHISDWLARARFVVDEVLSRCAETETFDDNDRVLPASIKQQTIPAPEFSAAQHEIIRRKFSRSAV
jgi:hypothetical protein